MSPGNAPLSLTLLVPFTLRVDRAAPTISDLAPTPGSATGNNRPTVVANVFDLATQEIDIYTPTISVDGVDVTSLAQTFPQFAGATSCCYNLLTIVYTPRSAMADGSHVATVTTRDFAGNVASMSWSWWVDASPPSIVLTSPEDHMVTDQAVLPVEGRTESGAVLTVEGAPVAVSVDGSFATTVTLLEGARTITIVARDALGNEETVTRAVVYDSTGPTLSGVRSTEGSRTRAGLTVIKATSSEPLAWATVNGASAQVFADGSLTAPVSLSEGVNAFTIQVADFAGHVATTSLSVVRDSTPPAIALTVPSTRLITDLGTNLAWVNGSVSGGASSVTVNGFSVATGDGTFGRQFSLSVGANVFVIEAKDDLGNRATTTVVVTYAPVVQEVQRSYNTVIMGAVAGVLLVVGLLVGRMMWGGGGGASKGTPPDVDMPEPQRPEPEEIPAEEEMTTEEEEL